MVPEGAHHGIEGISEQNMVLETEKRWLLWALVDPDRLILFYDKYYGRIYAYLYRMTLDPDLAKDLTADTFLKAQQNLGRFTWRGVSFGSWLYQIATNEFRAHYRRSKKRRETELNDDFYPDSANSALIQILLEEDQRIVFQAVMRLTQPCRDTFLLHYWEGRTVKQIAYILKIPEGTVSSHLRRGRERLKKELKGLNPKGPGPRFGMKNEGSAD